MKAAYDSGVNFFDSAEGYAGKSSIFPPWMAWFWSVATVHVSFAVLGAPKDRTALMSGVNRRQIRGGDGRSHQEVWLEAKRPCHLNKGTLFSFSWHYPHALASVTMESSGLTLLS